MSAGLKNKETGMSIRIYNTLSGKKEIFEPVEKGKVGLYVCGPTVYDSCHMGHARSVVIFDTIVRYFKARGFEVTYVRNFTDIDDKIIKRANESGVSSFEIAEKYIKEFYEDMDALNNERATVEPKATDNIPQIISHIAELIDKSMAYEVEGNVYYSVESFKDYGKLSGRNLENMEAGARIEIDKSKNNPFDFALWKAAKPGEPSWESPWGNGRPGWHIECSAMSRRYLGPSFDIHGGGKDLIFPHHENEIAQSEGAIGGTFARYWIHNGFVNINHEKMSKSLGNFLVIKDVLKLYHPDSIRLFLLSNHYRSPIDFTDQALHESTMGLDKIYSILQRIEEDMDINGTDDKHLPDGEAWERFRESMDDDFNTARGIGVLFELVRKINRQLDQGLDGTQTGNREFIESGRADILKIGGVLGILEQTPTDYFKKTKDFGITKKSVDPAFIEKKIKDREQARKEKNWELADQVRNELEEMNIVLEDRKEGTVWKFKE